MRITSSPDVSREHLRLRRDSKTGRFYLIDLSSLGTTLNGRHVPKGYDEVDGTKRENGAETHAAGFRTDRFGGHRLPRVRSGSMMTALLWARLLFLSALAAIVGLCVWTAYRTE